MSSRADLLNRQRRWAFSTGLNPDYRGYLSTVEDNLFQPLSESTRRAFEQGSGSELLDTPSRPAKMKALHSSSALAVNVFDNWVERDKGPLQRALGLEREITSIAFEGQYPTGLLGNPPNLDVVLELADGHIIGIESKFSEWMTPKPKGKEPFKDKYFPEGEGLWAARGLPRCQALAEGMRDGRETFRYLDVAQLLKHALGLATQLGEGFSLFYIYYDWPGKASNVHRDEVERLHQDYLAYLQKRYVLTASMKSE